MRLLSSYGYRQCGELKRQLTDVRDHLSKDIRKPLSARRYHLVFTEVLISVEHQVSIDGHPPLKRAFIEPISRRTFANFLNAPVSLDVLSVHTPTLMFVDAGLQLLTLGQLGTQPSAQTADPCLRILPKTLPVSRTRGR